MKTSLYILVENFSSSKREEFFEKELPIWINYFDKIVVIPLYKGNEKLLYNHPKIEVKQFNMFAPCNRIRVIGTNFFRIMSVYLYELVNTHHKSSYLKNAIMHLNTLVLRIDAARRFEKEFEVSISNSVIYSYWFNQWVLMLSLLNGNKRVKFITRAHGSDYKEEQIGRLLPFRYFQLKRVLKICTVSEYAKNYLMDKYKCPGDKIQISRLGIHSDYILAPINDQVLRIVSCSSLIPLKRVHLIVEIIKQVNIPIEWTHFGSGPEQERIETISRNIPKHIDIHLKGHVPNDVFHLYLKTVPISFFINVSEHEGLPVTLMEAASYGIPLIATNVGGVREIVNESTGHLIDCNFETIEVAKYIEQQHLIQRIYSKPVRKDAMEFVKKYFNASNNFEALAYSVKHELL